YSVMINGITSAAVTKLDILRHLDEFKVCVGYSIDGKVIKTYPTDSERLESVKPVYEVLPVWKIDISECKSNSELPVQANLYPELQVLKLILFLLVLKEARHFSSINHIH